jgi:hypothetical protein
VFGGEATLFLKGEIRKAQNFEMVIKMQYSTSPETKSKDSRN